MRNKWLIFRPVVWYFVLSFLWIVLSDRAVEIIFKDPEQIVIASTIKGWLYTVVVAVVLYLLIKSSVEELNRANEKKMKFISSASHELRTPLTQTKWNIELLEKETKNKEHLEILRKMDKSNKRLIELVGGLLEEAKL